MQSPQKVRGIYIHQLEEWPQFRWNRERVAEALATVVEILPSESGPAAQKV